MNEHLQHIPAIKEMIECFHQCIAYINKINNLPDPFRIRADRTLTILANSAAHAIDIPGVPLDDAVSVSGQVEFGPITNFLGKEIPKQVAIDTKKITVASDEFQEFKAKCNAIMESMATLSPKQFYDLCNENEIRGVAKLLGMDVTSTEPEKITLELVREMFAAYEKKQQLDTIDDIANEGTSGVDDKEKEELIEQITEKIIAQHNLAFPNGPALNDEQIAEGKKNLEVFVVEQLREMLSESGVDDSADKIAEEIKTKSDEKTTEVTTPASGKVDNANVKATTAPTTGKNTTVKK